jgi:hypothetical protein
LNSIQNVSWVKGARVLLNYSCHYFDAAVGAEAQ